MQMGQTNAVDPILVRSFQIFAAVKLAIALFSAVFPFLGIGMRLPRQLTNPWYPIVEALFLIGFLSIPWLRWKMGKFFLPVAIMIATLGPIISNAVSFELVGSEEIIIFRSLASQWQLVFLLFVPLILLSWQYPYRVVVIYALGLAIVDLVLIIPFTQSFPRPWIEVGPILYRTSVYLLVGYIVNRLVKSQREQTASLQQAYRNLSAFATTNEHLTLSRERNRLARELHDTLAHTLSAVAVQLEAVSSLWETNPEQAHLMLSQSLEQTRSGLAETRRAIQALRAAPVEDMGLPMALTNLAQTYAERYQLGLELSVPTSVSDWGAEVETGFYRIAEESLRNVAQHAGASTLALRLSENNETLTEIIQDNGRGFNLSNPSQDEERFGLKGMKERAAAIGASLTIESQPGAGTSITLTVAKGKMK